MSHSSILEFHGCDEIFWFCFILFFFLSCLLSVDFSSPGELVVSVSVSLIHWRILLETDQYDEEILSLVTFAVLILFIFVSLFAFAVFGCFLFMRKF